MARGKSMKRTAHGFTLVELLITVAVIGITLKIAIPSFRGMVVDARLSGQANDLLGSLKYTRSEAVKRNARVTMCKRATDITCAVTTTATADWKGGWLIFTDGGVQGVVDGTDTVLRVQNPLTNSTLIGDGNVTNFVSYVGTGQSSAAGGGAQVGTFSLCGDLATAKRRKIDLTVGTGWVGVRTVDPSAVCAAS